jgi:hypothetical protein
MIGHYKGLTCCPSPLKIRNNTIKVLFVCAVTAQCHFFKLFQTDVTYNSSRPKLMIHAKQIYLCILSKYSCNYTLPLLFTNWSDSQAGAVKLIKIGFCQAKKTT